MSTIPFVAIEAEDVSAARAFYAEAFGLGERLRVRQSSDPSSGFRGFTLSLIASQPANVDAIVWAALEAGASTVTEPTKSLWGYGGVLRAPDGTVWQVSTSSKKDSAEPSRMVDEVVLLIAPEDVKASRGFYEERGYRVGKSMGKYVEFDMGSSPIGFGLYSRKALAKAAGVAPEGSGSHRLVIGTAGAAFTDPDGFEWAPAAAGGAEE
ncbi:MAG TPA: glyoxalase [Terrimesophilobacter sp.]|nr:glyoxalase [Terrimesophilobacter sp.]HRQ00676.1 glyoxalase [Terrimesophilobacter sp.]